MPNLTTPFEIDPALFNGPVLVTGAGGCIGAWALAILSASGVPVVALDLGDDRYRPAMMMGKDEADALTWETGDIADYERLKGVIDTHGIRAIIHLAGLQIPFCAANPAMGARVNVEGTINVLQAARETGIKRTVFASSVAAHGLPVGGAYHPTLYGAYKVANEQTAAVYWQDWQVPSVCLRPNVVYGVARDQGVSAKFTLALHAAVLGEAYEIPYSGGLSWLHAGEAAAAFIAAVSHDGEGAFVFDLNGRAGTVEEGLEVLKEIAPDAQVTVSGKPFPFPSDMDETPVRSHLDYPSVATSDGIRETYQAFQVLHQAGLLPPLK